MTSINWWSLWSISLIDLLQIVIKPGQNESKGVNSSNNVTYHSRKIKQEKNSYIKMNKFYHV